LRCFRASAADRLGGKHSAEVIINAMDFAKIIHYVYGDLWDEGAVYIHAMAASLERAGAAFVMIVFNTWHRAADKFMEGINTKTSQTYGKDRDGGLRSF
jgi:aspartate racemase